MDFETTRIVLGVAVGVIAAGSVVFVYFRGKLQAVNTQLDAIKDSPEILDLTEASIVRLLTEAQREAFRNIFAPALAIGLAIAPDDVDETIRKVGEIVDKLTDNKPNVSIEELQKVVRTELARAAVISPAPASETTVTRSSGNVKG